MDIKEIEEKDKSQFNQLAEEFGTIYNSTNWAKLFGTNAKCYGVYDDSSTIIAGFSIFVEKKMGFTIYRDLPLTKEIGPFFFIESNKYINILTKKKRILRIIAEYLNSLQYSLVALSLNYNVIDTQPFIWKKFKVNPAYTYIINLNTNIDKILNGMSISKRRSIKKGMKNEVELKIITNYNEIIDLILKTFIKNKIYNNEKHVKKVLFDFANENNSFAFGIYNKSDLLATTFCLYDKTTAYYIFGGYNNNISNYNAGPITMWHSIKHSKEIGLNRFDFEGSMVPNIERYFRDFGAEIVPYYKIYKAKLPIEIFLKFYKREIF